MEQQLLAIRIKDGVFVGNQQAAYNGEFLSLNKVSHIINCAGSEMDNAFDGTTHYLTFNWLDKPGTLLFDSPEVVRDVTRFIDEALEVGQCALISSPDGVNRGSALAVAYLMSKYGWCLRSAHDFVLTAHPDSDIRTDFISQLKKLEPAFTRNVENDILHPNINTSSFSLDNEQWCLRNTYLNSLSFDHQRNAATRKMIQNLVPEKRGVKKKLSFNMTTTAPFQRCPEGSILVQISASLQHPIESADGNTCPMGPWEIKKSQEQLQMEEEKRMQQLRERERHAQQRQQQQIQSRQQQLQQRIAEQRQESQHQQQQQLQQQLQQQRLQIEQMHRSSKADEENRPLFRKGRQAKTQFMRRSSPLPTRVSRRKEPITHTYSYDLAPQHAAPAVMRVQSMHGFAPRNAPKEKQVTPRSEKALTPREKQRQAANIMKPTGRASPSHRMRGYSSEFPTPSQSRILSGTHQPPKPSSDTHRSTYRILNTLRNSSPSDRLLRPTANSTARNKLRGA